MPNGVLFVHNNFPAQFRDLAETLTSRGVACAAIGSHASPGLSSVPIARYSLSQGTTPGIFQLAVRAEADLLRARAAYHGAMSLKETGFEADVIVGHAGWGETSLLTEAFPEARQALFHEFFYRPHGLDTGFDPEFSRPLAGDGALRVKAKNAVMSLAYTDADLIVAPTEFQRSTLPDAFQPRTRVIHEGVDVEAIRPQAPAPFELPDGRVIAPGAPVITHINNQMEPLRGLHIFARALPRLLAEVPDARVIIIGSERAKGYGGDAPDGKTWKQVCFEGVDDRIDHSRVHLLGKVPHAQMLHALQLSTAHVYYTYPFVLSWSLAEAMASGCFVIGSDTPPLRDAIEDGVDGRLLPFFDVDALSELMIEACRRPEQFAGMRRAARRAAEAKFSRAKGRAAWLDLLKELGATGL